MHPDLEASLVHCRNLPSPPAIALQIIELAQDPDADLATAARVIAMDPALSARLLRVANSPLYAGRRRVETLAQATTMLGLNATLSLALGFSLARGLRATDGAAAEQERLWKRSVLSALAARLLGEHAGLERLEDLMLAGLLQDIGALALLQARPDAWLALQDGGRVPAPLEREREVLGDDHAAAGAWLARQWQLPDHLCDAIAASEGCPAPANAFQACVFASGAVATLWLADDDPDGALRTAAEARIEAGGIGGPGTLDSLLAQMASAAQGFGALFDMRIVQPAHLQAIIEQARELLVLRNLREIQEAARARREADASREHIRHLTEQARRDPLTGVYNRMQLEEALEREFAAASAAGQPLSIAFVDLDGFKQINDRHGHLVGDQVLRQFAQTLQRLLRSTDLVARYGGEEFLVVLAHSNEAAAARVLRRILEETARTPMAVVDGHPLYVTFSAGVASRDGHDSPFADARAMLQAADQALYLAKRRGRNQVGQHGQ
ncbi:GGDEF domain-containing protein [Pseudoxanthomonas sp. SGNA-20]|jgi:diguanylate cyclase (GGDEF) domain|uniref:GGDEF domain-containing protein n=1 Tax=Pseudoxanthomonas sp. SGNA-20 TaxID=2493088 RepID=UPI000F641DF2|nr:GGDEF domain-containing protein [Pseudoxanthomonas sp. SGNA-20]RRN58595.1 GGDEF domain-containing protein [Pseudoxanthomonas sp. SGNA-20]